MLDPTEPDEEDEYLRRVYGAVQGLSDASGASRKPDLPSQAVLAHPEGDRVTGSVPEPHTARPYELGAPEMTVAVRRAMLLADLERTLALLRALEDE